MKVKPGRPSDNIKSNELWGGGTLLRVDGLSHTRTLAECHNCLKKSATLDFPPYILTEFQNMPRNRTQARLSLLNGVSYFQHDVQSIQNKQISQ